MRSIGVTPRGFHTHAMEYFAAAEAVHGGKTDGSLPLMFLWGRTIELVLKSYLLSEGVSIARLRSKAFGHNLRALSEEAEGRAIAKVIGDVPLDRAVVRALNWEYVTKRLEYRESGTMYLMPDAKLTRAAVRRLLNGVDHHLRENHGI